MLKGRIIATVGVSGSGKSTWAHNKWKEDPLNTVIIERDKIRNLLFGYNDFDLNTYYSREDKNKLEKEITSCEKTLTYDALERGKTVILANTHINIEHLRGMKYWNVPVELKFFELGYKDSLIINSQRTRGVGKNKLRSQVDRLRNLKDRLEKDPIDFNIKYINNSGKKKCYVFDIDGCLADKTTDRMYYDWSRVGEDSPIKEMVNMLETLSNESDCDIFICSGREDVCIKETVEWFNRNTKGAEKFSFMLRPEGDMRPDWVVKGEMVEEIVKTNTISVWFDDRLSVTRHLRALGIRVLNVMYNNF